MRTNPIFALLDQRIEQKQATLTAARLDYETRRLALESEIDSLLQLRGEAQKCVAKRRKAPAVTGDKPGTP